jgi:cyclophilin family peptidyl-prolyl cis-trans isomerase
MKKIVSLFLVLMTCSLFSCKEEHNNLPDGLYAEMETSKGTILIALDYTKTPVTVANFVTLVEGRNPFVTKELKGRPFYDGLKFHRVISKKNGDSEDFMIQGGDPLGNGSGDCGYKFEDEITDLKFDTGGLLAMANSGPGTNSSQFFITLKDTPWLDGKHTIFGHVVENGMEFAGSIIQNDIIKTVTIIRKGEAVKKYDALKVFSDYFKMAAENQKKEMALAAENKKLYDAKYKVIKEQKAAFLYSLKTGTTKTASGLIFKILKKGSGKKPAKGDVVYMNYAGFLEDGTLFDSNVEAISKAFGKFDNNRALQNGYAPSPYQMGSNDLISGFVEGIEQMNFGDKAIMFIPSELGYGAQGAGNVIPPNATTIFEVELLEINTK